MCITISVLFPVCMKEGRIGLNLRGQARIGNAAMGLSWAQDWQVETGGSMTLWSPISTMLFCVMRCVLMLYVGCKEMCGKVLMDG